MFKNKELCMEAQETDLFGRRLGNSFPSLAPICVERKEKCDYFKTNNLFFEPIDLLKD